MAIKATCHFVILLLGDGSSNSITVSLTTAPFALAPPDGSSTFQPTFSLSTLLPTGVNNVTANDGIVTTATLGLLGTITFNFATTPPASNFSVSGFFEF